jgi:hypothetical protein
MILPEQSCQYAREVQVFEDRRVARRALVGAEPVSEQLSEWLMNFLVSSSGLLVKIDFTGVRWPKLMGCACCKMACSR